MESEQVAKTSFDEAKHRRLVGVVMIMMAVYVGLCVWGLAYLGGIHADGAVLAVAAIYVNVFGFVLLFSGAEWARRRALPSNERERCLDIFS